ncbi:MAG: NFACT RNA binding domain-containing protein [Pyrinomonadaceae bacterium]|nr:NFACT RNA binding domain-containing protein [Pyrinomonadaceae bacterium]
MRDAETRKRTAAESFPPGEFASLSESLDAHFLKQEAERIFQSKANAARSKIKQEISKREKLARKLNQDLGNHGDAETWKRLGDLLFANLATAKRHGDKISVTDYYDENAPTIEIEVDENISITDAAGKFFRRYTKARNAQTELSQRLKDLETKISELLFERERIEDAIAEKDEPFLMDFTGEKIEEKPTKSKDKSSEDFTGARRYNSSEGFEILVGKGSKDNDFLTFRVAKSSDLWLHAADYPGSHVVVKNPNRVEIPNKTLIEAAQFAAFFSRAREQPKVAVHYTQKKFVNKPKGAGAGLVSLSSFKTILVEPKIGEK